MSTYSKLIAALLGNVVAIVMVYFASRGLGSCDFSGNCTLFGFTTAQIQGAITIVVTSIFVHQAPANTGAQ